MLVVAFLDFAKGQCSSPRHRAVLRRFGVAAEKPVRGRVRPGRAAPALKQPGPLPASIAQRVGLHAPAALPLDGSIVSACNELMCEARRTAQQGLTQLPRARRKSKKAVTRTQSRGARYSAYQYHSKRRLLGSAGAT